MTRKKFSEVIEDAAAAEQADPPLERIFDFTEPVEGFDADTKSVYYRLRRVATLAGDESRLPDGKTFTESQVIEILGEDYAQGLVIDKKCCG